MCSQVMLSLLCFLLFGMFQSVFAFLEENTAKQVFLGGPTVLVLNTCNNEHFHRSSLLWRMIGDRALAHLGFGFSSASLFVVFLLFYFRVLS